MNRLTDNGHYQFTKLVFFFILNFQLKLPNLVSYLANFLNLVFFCSL